MTRRTFRFCIYAVLAAVWIATPFMGDRVASWLKWTYWIVLVSASITGLVVAVRGRHLLLGVVSTLTV